MAAKKTPLKKTEGATVIDLTKGGPRMTTATQIKRKFIKEWDLFQKAKLQKAKDAAALKKAQKPPRTVRVTKKQLRAMRAMPKKEGRKKFLRSKFPVPKPTKKEIAIAATGGALIPELIRQYNKKKKGK